MNALSSEIANRMTEKHEMRGHDSLDITYEDLVEDFAGTVSKCLSFIGCDAVPLTPVLSRMDDIDYAKHIHGWLTDPPDGYRARSVQMKIGSSEYTIDMHAPESMPRDAIFSNCGFWKSLRTRLFARFSKAGD